MRSAAYAMLIAQLAAIPVASVCAQARTHQLSGDVWSEADSGRVVMASHAIVYLWPDNSDVMSAINLACTASSADMASWMIARQALNDTNSSIPVSTTVTHDLALLRSIAQLPHATVEADSMGRFAFDSIPSGSYWVEAETTLNGRIVQWWKTTTLLKFPFRIGGVNSMALAGSRLGPLELHSSQFCTSPEPRVGAAAFATDTPLGSPDHVYEARELDRRASVTFSGDPTPYPESMRKMGIPGEVTLSFVIDANGRAEVNSIRVLSSTAPAFVEPAKQRVATMRFAPAESQGRKVRSRVMQTFSFSVQP
jgi:TonB family protein